MSFCVYEFQMIDLPSLSVVTKSEAKPVPKWLKSEKVVSEVKGPVRATVSNLAMIYK
jgi:hypothetical protein